MIVDAMLCVCAHVHHSPKGRLELLMLLSVATACEATARQALREAALQVSPCTHTHAGCTSVPLATGTHSYALGKQPPWCYACGAWRAAHSALSAHPLPGHASGAFAAHPNSILRHLAAAYHFLERIVNRRD